jgi:hypothetical protein
MKKNQYKYINFPIYFLSMPSLENVIEFALQFCSYEMMVLNNVDRYYFE